MITLMLLFAIQVAVPQEMACVGSVQEMKAPENVYIAGVEGEGMAAFGLDGQILYLNGPGVSSLKVGSVQRVIRPEGRVRDPRTKVRMGTYYKDIGTIQIQAVQQGSATARVISNCMQGMIKGDVVVPSVPKTVVEFTGSLSNDLTPIPNGISSSIALGKDDLRELSAGKFCFIHLGKKDGVKIGDQFIAFRPQPKYNSLDLVVAGTGAGATYSRVRNGMYRFQMDPLLSNRTIPPKVLGDIVVIDVGDSVSTGKIVNSFEEIHRGDMAVKK